MPTKKPKAISQKDMKLLESAAGALPEKTRAQVLQDIRTANRLRANSLRGKSGSTLASESARNFAEAQKPGAGVSEDVVKKFLALNPAELNVLTMIAEGRPPRHAATILNAIRLKLEYTVKKPQSEDAKSAPVTVVVNTIGEASVETTPAEQPTTPEESLQ
jgi:hypothetical protein